MDKSPEMLRIPAGNIVQRDDRNKTHWHAHINPFELGRHLVTQQLYTTTMTDNPSAFSGINKPVENVSWYDAVAFCNALSQAQGYQKVYHLDAGETQVIAQANGYRLPTDAEWEYACRAGSVAVQYGDINNIAWFEGNSAGQTQNVGLKQPNAFGLFDMLGNVWEWCWDLYDAEVYGPYRIFRGGGWSDTNRGCLASNRRRSHPSYQIDDLGFRVARNL